MKTLIGFLWLVSLGLLLQVPVTGQNNNEAKVFYEVEQMPEYLGGFEKLKQFISENISYPEEAKKEGIQGKVFVSFTVNKEGKVVNAEIAKGVHSSLDEEALRVVESMPAWTPGKKDGQAVNVGFTLPVEFKLAPEKKE